jgi:hypothetical protein
VAAGKLGLSRDTVDITILINEVELVAEKCSEFYDPNQSISGKWLKTKSFETFRAEQMVDADVRLAYRAIFARRLRFSDPAFKCASDVPENLVDLGFLKRAR